MIYNQSIVSSFYDNFVDLNFIQHFIFSPNPVTKPIEHGVLVIWNMTKPAYTILLTF